jgi:uncharacterized membrane protein
MASFVGYTRGHRRRRRGDRHSGRGGPPRLGDLARDSGVNGSAADPVSRLASGLGYFSLTLGTTQVIAPGLVDHLIGIRDDRTSRRWQRVVGLQELSAAAGILPQRRPLEWLWARTTGDVVHLTMLARAYRSRRESAARLGFAMASVLGCFIADAYASVRMTADPELTQEETKMKGHATMTIRAPREELATRWRSFEQEAPALARLGPIEIVGEDAERIEWRTTDAAKAQARGVTRFKQAPDDRGTEIHIDVEFDAPGGAIGAAVMKVTGEEPLQLVRDDLRRLKQLVETGEIARSDGAPSGPSARLQPKQRPAQPLEHVPA